MSDVSKTSAEMIAEARFYESPGHVAAYADGTLELLRDLADALEAATRVPAQGEPNDEPELVDVVLTTADIEQLAHLLVQLSPATQKNSGATVRRLMQEMNIKEVEQ